MKVKDKSFSNNNVGSKTKKSSIPINKLFNMTNQNKITNEASLLKLGNNSETLQNFKVSGDKLEAKSISLQTNNTSETLSSNLINLNVSKKMINEDKSYTLNESNLVSEIINLPEPTINQNLTIQASSPQNLLKLNNNSYDLYNRSNMAQVNNHDNAIDQEPVDLQLEALSLNKTIKFTGEKLNDFSTKTTAELTGIINQAIDGIFVKNIIITYVNSTPVLTVVAFDLADFALLKQKDWQKRTFGGLNEIKQPIKLYVHVMVNKSLNLEDEKLKAELRLQGVVALVKDKEGRNNRYIT